VCRYRHRKHHQLSSKNSDNPFPSTKASSHLEVTQPPTDGIVATSNTTSVGKKQPMVLLQTAQDIALSNPGGSSVAVCVLFDTGRQLSYITDKLKGQLRPKPIKIERLPLKTLLVHKAIECSVVKLYFQGQTKGVAIFALTSPVICSP